MNRLPPSAALLLALCGGILIAPFLAPGFSSALLIAAVLFAGGGLLLLRHRPGVATLALLLALTCWATGRTVPLSRPGLGDVARFAGGPSVWVYGEVTATTVRASGREQDLTIRVRGVDRYRGLEYAEGLLQVIAPGSRRAANLLPGDQIGVRGRIERPRPASNPGGFDYAAYLRRRGIFATLRVRGAPDLRPLPPAAGSSSWPGKLVRLPIRLRRVLLSTQQRHLSPENAALLGGLMVAERGRLPGGVEENFRRAGISHLLCTSGLHLGIIASVTLGLLTLLPLRRGTRHGMAILLLWGYALAAGAGSSVLRAAIMVSVVLAAPLLGRVALPRHALIVAGVVILLARPLALYDPGAQLSFATLAALLTWMPLLERYGLYPETGMPLRTGILRMALSVFIASLVAQAGSWPIIAANFNELSVIAAPANLLAVPLATALLLLGMVASLICLLPFTATLWPVLGLWALLDAGLTLLRLIAGFWGQLPGAMISVPAPPLLLIAIYYGIFFGTATLLRRRIRRRVLFAPSAAASG